jgi:putative zinc finger/helix-turn-helix YgiT family protein
MNARKVRLIKGDNNACPKCGSTNVASRTYGDTVDFRNLEFDVDGLLDSKCQQCSHVWITHEQETQNHALIRGAYTAERDRLRAQQGLLSGLEIAQIREHLKLNQREAAALFGGGYNAFNKYESGEVLQSFAMDRLLRLTKVVGRPAVSFLRDVDSPPAFTVIPMSSTSTTSDANYMGFVFSQTSETIGKLRSVLTSSDSAIESLFVQSPRQTVAKFFGNNHENYAIGRR